MTTYTIFGSEYENEIEASEDLTRFFVDMIDECAPDFPKWDIPATNETFNNWTDGLCKDGEICTDTYNEICSDDDILRANGFDVD